MTETGIEAASDVIEKEIVMKAPRAKVWRALTDAQQFGRWFGAEIADPFAPRTRARGRIAHPPYEHLTFELEIERMEPEHLFSWRWHPYAVDPAYDYSAEPTTLVVFELAEVPEGTRVRVTESGFERIPLARRAEAFLRNSNGWAQQMKNIERYVAEQP
jgi:uncharacterized protein YndB with AHSA1/START domain